MVSGIDRFTISAYDVINKLLLLVIVEDEAAEA